MNSIATRSRARLTVVAQLFGLVMAGSASRASAANVQAAPIVAHVLEASGDWRIDGRPGALVAGSGLVAGAKIVAVSDHVGDVVTLVRDADLSRSRTVCEAGPNDPCRLPVSVGDERAGDGSAAALPSVAKAVLGVLLDKPPAVLGHYALTLTRGTRSVYETEAVLTLDPAAGLVLPPAPPELDAGTYTLTISPAAPAPNSAAASPSTVGAKASLTRTVTLKSDGTWRAVPFSDAGLYAVSIANADGEQVGDELLFVARPGDYAAASGAFDAVKQRTGAWLGPSARDDEHVMLRSCLLVMSRGP
jgi:hypothetical protein